MLEHLSQDPVLNALPLAAIVTDVDGRIVAWNPQAEVLYGWRAEEVIGRPIFDVNAPPGWPEGRQMFDAIVAGERHAAEIPLLRRDGSTFLAYSTATPVRDSSGAVVGLLGLSEDVTDRRVTQEAHTEASERLRLALDAGRLGTWEYDVSTDLMHISHRFEEILGLQPGQFGGTRGALDSHVHPDDRDLLAGARQEALDHALDIRAEYRVVRPDGEVRWIEGRGNLRVTDGRITGSIGVVMDVTDRREAEAQRAALARRLSLQARAVELVTELDVESRLDALAALIVPALAECCAIHLVEPEGIRLAGVRHADPSLQPYFRELIESFPVGVDQPYGAGAVIASGQPQLLPEVADAVLVATTKDRPESLAGFRALQLRSGFSVPLISRGRALGALSLGRTSDSAWTEDDRALVEQIASTAALALDNAQIYGDEHVARAASERNLRRLGLLAEVTTALVRSLDLDHVLDALAGLLVPRLAEMCTIDVVDEGRTRLVAVRAIDDAAIASLREAEVRRPRRLNEAGAVAQVIRSGVPLLIADVDNDFLRERAVDDEQLKQLLALDIHSSAIAPITARGHVLGAISLLGLGPDGRRFADEDVDLLVEIGKRAGLAIDNAQLYGREHSLAEALQRSLLPELMPLPGLDVAARYLPSSDHAQVGGDWFDAFPLADGAVGIAVGDAMGHDPRASGAMGQLRSVLRSYAFEGALPGVVLEKLDRLVQGFAMAQLATVFYGRLEPAGSDGSRLFRYSSAGHPPPLLCSPGGDSKLLDDGQSIVIGVPLDDTDRPEAVVTLSPGSLLICYTDGLVEGRHRPIDRGTAILRDAVQSLGPGASANEVCDHVITVMVGEDRDDDIAVLVVGLREDSR